MQYYRARRESGFSSNFLNGVVVMWPGRLEIAKRTLRDDHNLLRKGKRSNQKHGRVLFSTHEL